MISRQSSDQDIEPYYALSHSLNSSKSVQISFPSPGCSLWRCDLFMVTVLYMLSTFPAIPLISHSLLSQPAHSGCIRCTSTPRRTACEVLPFDLTLKLAQLIVQEKLRKTFACANTHPLPRNPFCLHFLLALMCSPLQQELMGYPSSSL